VYVLKDGRVVAEGTFDELKTNSTIFKELWRHQQEKGVTSQISNT
jgi:ATP-binding cassette, subfamily B, bacterial